MSDPYVPSTQKGIFANAVVWIVAILVVCALVTGAVWAFRYFTASTAGKVSAQQQIQSGPSRIAAYNHFFDLCAGVQADETRLDAQKTELAGTTDAIDRSRIEANIAGISGDRSEAIFEYNADARKSYTIGQFRASRLPYQLPVGPYNPQEGTSCGT